MNCEKCGKPLDQCTCEKPAGDLPETPEKVNPDHGTIAERVEALGEKVKTAKKKAPGETKLETEQKGIALEDLETELDALKTDFMASKEPKPAPEQKPKPVEKQGSLFKKLLFDEVRI